MKLTIVVITAFLMQVSASTSAQFITLKKQNIPLKMVFAEIRKQTGYTVLYGSNVISNKKPIDVNLNNVPLNDALTQILQGQDLAYSIEEKSVVISKKEPSFLDNIIARFQAIDVRGRVVDSEGNALPGATVKVKGSDKAATTDANGEFFLQGIDEGAWLSISYIGYQIKEIKVKKGLGSITMSLITNDLQEVTVNKGYYTTKKVLETGNVTTITAEEIGRQPISNPLSALQGTVPGMVISQKSGIAGGGFNVQIRGKNSLDNGNDPLYVIDGVPYASQTLGSINRVLQGGNPLNFINPSDIESISVLKDADATSIYGSRGANGVVLITTKKGSQGKSKVDINLSNGFGKASRLLDGLMNTQQYLEMRNEAFKNDGMIPTSDPGDPTGVFAPDLKLWDTTRHTDWQKVFIGGTAHYTDAQGSISGGTDNVQYLLGAGYHKEGTVMPGDGADQKGSVHFNLSSISVNKKLKMTFSGSFLSDKNTVSQSDGSYYVTLAPDAPDLYNSDGSLNWAPFSPGGSGTWANPMADFLLSYKGSTNNLLGNSTISYEVLPGLEIKSSLGYTSTQTREVVLQPTTAFDPGDDLTSGYSNFNNTRRNSWIIEPQAVYNLAVGRSKISALVGATFQKDGSEGESFRASGFSSNALLGNISAATSLSSSIIDRTYKYTAIFGRINYNWADRYLINLTTRRDGSSHFGPGKQFANFVSAAGAWVFTEEEFFKEKLGFLSYGKLKMSYGTSGSDQVGDYRFLDLYSTTKSAYQGTKGLYPKNLFNPELAWELNRKLEIGLDVGALNNRINLAVSYYRNRSSNQLVSSALPLITGFLVIDANLPANVQNSGYEVTLNTSNIKGANLNWTSSFNLTVPFNRLLAFPGLENSSVKDRYIVGQPITVSQAYHYMGVDPASGVYQFADGGGNPTFFPENYTVIVNTAPRFYGGLQNSLTFKNFSFSMLFQFVKQKGQSIQTQSQAPGIFNTNQLTSVLNRWKNNGDLTNTQKFSQDFNGDAYNSYGNYYFVSDALYTDASFIRLKNMELSYSFSNVLKKQLELQNLRVFVQGQNLMTITHYVGFDPETQGRTLPPLKIFTVGIQLAL